MCFDGWVEGRGAQLTSHDLLDLARRTIVRLTPSEALEQQSASAVLVDIRSASDRESDGIAPGSVHVPRTVLEWRLDPASPWRNPYLASQDGPFILLCNHGWSSSLAASTLSRLGHEGIGDVIGGFEAWEAAGLPVVRCSPSRLRPGELPGMRPPDGQRADRSPAETRHEAVRDPACR